MTCLAISTSLCPESDFLKCCTFGCGVGFNVNDCNNCLFTESIEACTVQDASCFQSCLTAT